MLLTELVDYLFIRNGQHISATLDMIEMDLAQFWAAAEQEILNYERYVPLEKRFNITVMGTSPHVYDFSNDPNNPGQDIEADPIVWGNVPHRIKQVVPVGESQQIMNWAGLSKFGTMPGSLSHVSSQRLLKYVYDAPKLYIWEYGKMYVVAHYKHFIKKTYDTNEPTKLTQVEIVGMESSNILNDLLSGMFLQIVGRTRRAFTRQDLPITTDAEALVKEGKELYDEAKQLMYQRAKWSAIRK